MKKNLRRTKGIFIIGLLFTSLFFATVPTASSQSGNLVALEHVVNLEWAGEVKKPIVPLEEQVPLKIKVNYTVTAGAFLAKSLYIFHKDRQVNIKLEIVHTSPWAEVVLSQNTVTLTVPKESGNFQAGSAQIYLKVKKDAPALSMGEITIKASVDQVGLIRPYTREASLSFSPAYQPLITPDLVESNSKIIGPMDTAVFPIEVSNLGNARTTVFFEVDYLPSGWTAIVTDSITIDINSKGTAYLSVRPPRGFGYHDDRASVKVKMTPARAEDISDRGVHQTVSVIAESRGISFVGIEIVLPIIIIIIVIIIAVFILYTKKFKKQKK